MADAGTMAIATGAMVQSSIATEEARQAHKVECQQYVDKFESKGANTDAQLQFAECVQLLNPQPMSKSDHHAIQICIVVCLVVGIIAAWRTAESFYGDLEDYLMGFFLGAVLIGPCLCALGFAILYLFT